VPDGLGARRARPDQLFEVLVDRRQEDGDAVQRVRDPLHRAGLVPSIGLGRHDREIPPKSGLGGALEQRGKPLRYGFPGDGAVGARRGC
jgi:hypothetical protein